MPNPRLKPQPLPDFDRYTIDFDDSGRPWCFHLFWRDAEVANVRLEYHSDGYLNRAALRAGKGKQRYISLKDLANIPFFTTYIHRINLIDLISLISRITLIDRIALIDSITSIGNIESVKVVGLGTNVLRNNNFEYDFTGWYVQDTVKITIEADAIFGKRVKFDSAAGSLIQYLFAKGGKFSTLDLWAYKTAVGGANLRVRLTYTTGAVEDTTVTLTASWARYSVNVDTTRTLSSVGFTDLAGICFLQLPTLGDPLNVVLSNPLPSGSNTIGNLTQSTKHDAKVYQFTAAGSAADGATVINNVADKVIKIHRLFLQSTVDGATDVYFYEETSGNLVTTKATLNAREGRESAFVSGPACIGQTTTVNKKVLLKNAAAKQVNWEVTYSADDAS